MGAVDIFADAADALTARALLAAEQRNNHALRERQVWLEQRVHALELALAAARGQAPGLDALTAPQG